MSETNKANPILHSFKQNRIVIIYRGLNPEECLEVSNVLYDAGIRLFEVTMNSPDTEDSIRLLHSKMPSDTYIGAGTVRKPQQVKSVHDAGASYIISPNTNVEVIKQTKALGLISIPGAMTPTEVDVAVQAGADIIKIFPINFLGPEFIRQLKGPLDNIEFLACGGLKIEMVEDLFAAGCTSMGIGLQLLGKEIFENKQWHLLEKNAKEFINASQISIHT